MHNELLKRYYAISDEIYHTAQDEYKRIILKMSAGLSSDGVSKEESEPEENGKGLLRQHEVNMFSLLCLKISMGCQLIDEGHDGLKEQLKQDISDAVKNVKVIRFEWNLNDSIINDTLDVILAVCPEHETIITEQFKEIYNLNTERNGEVTEELYYLFRFAATYYENHGRAELAYTVLERLCHISRIRSEPTWHRAVVTGILQRIGDKAYETKCRIGDAEADRFENIVDISSEYFFWDYAYDLWVIGRMEEAADAFDKCYRVRKALYGADNWYTAIAKAWRDLTLFLLSDDEAGRESLYEFIDNTESGMYRRYAEENQIVISEGLILYFVLKHFCDAIEMKKELLHYLEIFERICNEYNDSGEPLIQIRLAKNFRGAYYMQTGNYIMAEKSFSAALNAEVPEEIPQALSDVQIKSNLLSVYWVQNDLDMAFPLMDELWEMICDEGQTQITGKDRYRILTAIVGIGLNPMLDFQREIEKRLKYLLEISCRDVRENAPELHECGAECAVFICTAAEWLFFHECAEREEQRNYLEILYMIEQDNDTFPLQKVRKALLYGVLTALTWNLGDPGAEFFLKKYLELSDDDGIPISSRISAFQTAAAYFGKRGDLDLSIHYIDRALSELTVLWQSSVCYLNDARLIQLLEPVQIQFFCCYAVLRKHGDPQTSYEKILQFKALASLAGRKRNRVIRGGQADGELAKRIRSLQDRIAALESENMFRDVSEEYEETMGTLRQMEADFAEKFPHNITIPDITWEKVSEAIPDRSVVVEYVCCTTDYGRMQFEEYDEDGIGVDIYIIRREGSLCSLRRLTISEKNGESIYEDAEEFVAILQAESENQLSFRQVERKDEVRSSLYQKLILPVLPYIGNPDFLYIAPDSGLFNLPFEMLYDEKEETLEDICNVIRIECARDFLFDHTDHLSSEGSFIIGNPQYKVHERRRFHLLWDDGAGGADNGEKRRPQSGDTVCIEQLPFSELEAKKAAEHCRSDFLTGRAASKYAFLHMKKCRNIHISTHGFFDLTNESNVLYSSCLLFSGAQNWFETGRESRTYGNGIVTADEVSRMDLRSVELVVLSSCLGGMNRMSFSKGWNGIIGAFSSAGVKYVIAHLWVADDFSAAVLMDAFYYEYARHRLKPPEALRRAKKYLKTVTVRELKEKGWFDFALHRDDVDEPMKLSIQRYMRLRDSVKPFAGEACWGGFSCYRCR